jgi:hypothetical protein
MTDSESGSDVAVVVYREDATWEVDLLPPPLTEDLAGLIQVQASVFLSDLTAAVDWPLARQVLAHLGLVIPDDEDLDQVLPAGDLSIFADLGLDEMDLGMIAGNLDLFPDEALAVIARKLGFGQAFERALTLALGGVP